MSEDTQNNIWSALFIIVLMALGALTWGIVKYVRRVVKAAIQSVREKSARPNAKSAKA